MIIGNDVWFVGHCIVSPIIAKDKSMAMVGSVIVKDMEENHVYGGSPARDMTDVFGPQFQERSIDEKYAMMIAKLSAFSESHPDVASAAIQIVTEYPSSMQKAVSYFNVSRRAYTKRRTSAEIAFMRFLLPLYKFVPDSFG